jgi:hypothetical protein
VARRAIEGQQRRDREAAARAIEENNRRVREAYDAALRLQEAERSQRQQAESQRYAAQLIADRARQQAEEARRAADDAIRQARVEDEVRRIPVSESTREDPRNESFVREQERANAERVRQQIDSTRRTEDFARAQQVSQQLEATRLQEERARDEVVRQQIDATRWKEDRAREEQAQQLSEQTRREDERRSDEQAQQLRDDAQREDERRSDEQALRIDETRREDERRIRAADTQRLVTEQLDDQQREQAAAVAQQVEQQRRRQEDDQRLERQRLDRAAVVERLDNERRVREADDRRIVTERLDREQRDHAAVVERLDREQRDRGAVVERLDNERRVREADDRRIVTERRVATERLNEATAADASPPPIPHPDLANVLHDPSIESEQVTQLIRELEVTEGGKTLAEKIREGAFKLTITRSEPAPGRAGLAWPDRVQIQWGTSLEETASTLMHEAAHVIDPTLAEPGGSRLSIEAHARSYSYEYRAAKDLPAEDFAEDVFRSVLEAALKQGESRAAARGKAEGALVDALRTDPGRYGVETPAEEAERLERVRRGESPGGQAPSPARPAAAPAPIRYTSSEFVTYSRNKRTYRTQVARVIAAWHGEHPLQFLLAKNGTLKKFLKARTFKYLKAHPELIQAGHARSDWTKPGENPIVVMTAYVNQTINRDVESRWRRRGDRAFIDLDYALDIGGVLVEHRSANTWVKKDWLDESIVKRATKVWFR